MTPEERAAETYLAMWAGNGTHAEAFVIAGIAEAIRAAEQDRDEEAAKFVGNLAIKMLGERRPDDTSRDDAHERCRIVGEVAVALRARGAKAPGGREARCEKGHLVPPRMGGQHTNGATVCPECGSRRITVGPAPGGTR